MNRWWLLASFLLVGTVPARSAVRIDVNYTIIEDEVSPRAEQHTGTGGATFVLNKGKVTAISSGYTSTNGLNGYVTTINRHGVSSVRHYIIGRGTITQVNETDGVRELTTVKTNGVDICEATTVFRPARGQRYIISHRISNGETMYLSGEHAINETCRIATVQSD